MPEPLETALAEVRDLLLGPGLRRAVAAGRRRAAAPSMVRAELRPVALKDGVRLQLVVSDGHRPHTRNVTPGPAAAAAVDALLAEPFGNWHVETATRVVQLRVTKRGEAQVHRAGPGPVAAEGAGPEPAADRPDPAAAGADAAADPARRTAPGPAARPAPDAPPDAPPGGAPDGHDRQRRHLIDPGDPLFAAVGASAAKRRQVDAFLRALAATLPDDRAELPSPLRLVDLGCGNAYLTFAAYRYLTGLGLTVEAVGVDVRDDARDRNAALAERLGHAAGLRFVTGTIAAAELGPNRPDLVLALHACDTATDEALARAVRWRARWVLAAPCCHHDLATQLRRAQPPAPYGLLTRHGILRERFAETLTDALRAALLRRHGYRVDVVEFVASTHTPRNLLLRATRTGAPPTAEQRAEYAALSAAWGVTPALAGLLG